ncbi:MAG: GNAT family N-acetyltransferase, partial [Anaerolineae bacterium]|nr:GNAT family N-acetyltransferase [Anaerolineae bacterium]
PDDRYTVRALTPADQVAFDVFQDHCTPDERAESDISIEQAGAFGVLDGDRIVAGASTYLWRGFVDVGVLTDPAYRHQGLGAAVVSAVCAHIIQTGAGIMVYRHVSTNRGSQGVAEKVGFSRFMMVESVQVGNGA